MTRKLLILVLSLFSVSVFADSDIYCPTQLVCKTDGCSGVPDQFHIAYLKSHYLGIYKFKAALGGKQGLKNQCVYERAATGNKISLETDALVVPNFKASGNRWVKSSDSRINTEVCIWPSPNACPFQAKPMTWQSTIVR